MGVVGGNSLEIGSEGGCIVGIGGEIGSSIETGDGGDVTTLGGPRESSVGEGSAVIDSSSSSSSRISAYESNMRAASSLYDSGRIDPGSSVKPSPENTRGRPGGLRGSLWSLEERSLELRWTSAGGARAPVVLRRVDDPKR